MRAPTWALALGALTTSTMSLPLSAQQSSADKQLSLTIYNDDLALVEHVRHVDVANGMHRIEFEGVSAQIMSQTVSFAGPGLDILEQNFDYDLLTPEKLIEKAVGRSVVLVRTNPATGEEIRETAEILSTFGGVVLRIGDRIEVLREDGLPARVIFDEVPPNLRARPTLSILLEAEDDVSADVTLAYLTSGLSWDADYVAQFDEAEGDVSIQGWVTLRNTSGTTFENARAQLIAGDVNTVGSADEWWQQYTRRFVPSTTRRFVPGAEPPAPPREQLADYYVYPIAESTTIANNQTKQISFLSADGVTATKGYEQTFYLTETFPPTSADVRVRFANSSANGLGEQLPGGVVRVYARDARGQPQFVGEDLIGHTSAGSELSLKIGDAFDVTVETTLVSRSSAPRRATDARMSYMVRNARSEPVVVTIRQENLRRFNEVREESIPGRRTDADSFAWDVPVPANGETELRVTIRQGPL
jgi:hypothetical protein